MKFSETQLGALLEEVKIAYLSGYPIVYIPTEQQELVERLLTDERCIHQIIPGVDISEEAKDEYVISNTPRNYRVEKNFEFKNFPELALYFGFSWEKDSKIGERALKIISGRHMVNANGRVDKEQRGYALKSLLIIVTPTRESVPAQFAPYVRIVDIPKLSDSEVVESILEPFFVSHGIFDQVIAQSYFEELSRNFRGFSRQGIESMLVQMWSDGLFDSFDSNSLSKNKSRIITIINQSKKDLMSGCIGLSWESLPEQINAGGMKNAVDWIQTRKPLLEDTERSVNNGHDIPKGILLSGIPGSGKSLLAKQTAITLGLPLISLNMGSVLGGVVGESEHNMDNALRMAERMAPCVLWIDEIEKAFSGSQSSNGDSGVAQRLFGKFLTWLQEKSAACFVFATANNITGLPPEFFRSERFDKKYYTFLPTVSECADIIVNYLKKENKVHREKLNGLSKIDRFNEPEALYEEGLLKPELWIDTLDDFARSVYLNSVSDSDRTKHGKMTWLWDGEKCPKTKMFTGADLTSLIKETKFLVRCANDELGDYKLSDSSRKKCRFEKKQFLESFKKLLKYDKSSNVQEFLSYGETNLWNIVDCFITLSENQFSPASNMELLNFKDFDLQEYVYDPSSGCPSSHAYDRAMFNTIVGAINMYTKDIMLERTH